MKITPVNNFAFKRLYLKDPVEGTADALSSIIKYTDTFEVLKDVLQNYCQGWTQYNRSKSSSSTRSVFYNKG